MKINDNSLKYRQIIHDRGYRRPIIERLNPNKIESKTKLSTTLTLETNSTISQSNLKSETKIKTNGHQSAFVIIEFISGDSEVKNSSFQLGVGYNEYDP
jgi:hypothetical protein